MRARFIPFAVIVVVALAACDGGGSGPDPSTPPPTSPLTSPNSGSVTHFGPPRVTVPPLPSDVPTTGPNLLREGEPPPRMPLEATQHTQAGAVAFAKFFELTIDWGYATTSTAYMKHYFTSGCVTCKSIQAGIDDARARGRHFIGDRLTITGVTGAAPTRQHGAEYSMVIAFDVTSVEVVDNHGQFVDGDRALKLRNQVSVHWTDHGWTVVYVVGTE